MAATATLLKGPTVEPGVGIKAIYSVALDTSFATGGEPIDVTGQFSYVFGGTIKGVDAIADATWRYDVVGPGATTAVTSTNVVIVAHHGVGTDNPDTPADAEDLSSVGALIVEIVGKAAIPTSWA